MLHNLTAFIWNPKLTHFRMYQGSDNAFVIFIFFFYVELKIQNENPKLKLSFFFFARNIIPFSHSFDNSWQISQAICWGRQAPVGCFTQKACQQILCLQILSLCFIWHFTNLLTFWLLRKKKQINNVFLVSSLPPRKLSSHSDTFSAIFPNRTEKSLKG